MTNPGRNHSVDSLKGLLMILVVIGHVLIGNQLRMVPRYLIYTFHMPLFVFMSGYLLNVNSLRRMTWAEIWRKYARRLILPWCAAWVVYTTWSLMHQRWGMSTLLHDVVHPYLHLWFIPSLFLMTCMVAVAAKCRISLWWVFALGCISIATVGSYPLPGICTLWPLVYLATGALSRAGKLPRRIGWSGVAVVMVLNAGMYFVVNLTPFTRHNSLMLLMPVEWLLCVAVGNLLHSGRQWRSATLEWIGRNSLQVYLWHMVPIIALKEIVPPTNRPLYYLIAAILLANFLLVVHCCNHRRK
jgi:fucose 4-O-acetylase-like acetyltransferase